MSEPVFPSRGQEVAEAASARFQCEACAGCDWSTGLFGTAWAPLALVSIHVALRRYHRLLGMAHSFYDC